MRCPECGGSGAKEWQQCPKHDGEIVCVACCRMCRYHNHESANGRVIVHKCRYHYVTMNLQRDLQKISELKEMLR